METNNDATAADEDACAETMKYLRDKYRFEMASWNGFLEADELARKLLKEHQHGC